RGGWSFVGRRGPEVMVVGALPGRKQPDCGLGGHVALMRHSLLQASPSLVLPSSHSSPAVVTPFPHRVIVQLLSQPSPSRLLPSSHSSPSAASIWPLPHSPDMHCALQPPTFGGSQCSRPATIPLPHADIVQLLSASSPRSPPVTIPSHRPSSCSCCRSRRRRWCSRRRTPRRSRGR